ncbi:hypothetical protein AKJ56_00785 [candidate division MSBL1 archaeon SCGC-AAA382N08]|uniref:histidine kinase n=1 Tax=candidate division MSBL1 archaeon SCGC-AAA382N08 TaxID=1698285 RepID=A0A133VQC2_9EURY|nr:hypothetical protein AKJ56_00785 [candidate division MSBL1 archaeon SCGC-AAA382N08]
MKEGVIIYTPDFKIISFNSAAEEIFGIKKDEVINQAISPSFTKKERFKSLAQVIFPSLAPRVIQVSDSGWPQVTQISTENGLNLLSIFTRTTDRNQNSTSFIKIIEDQTKEEKLTESKIDFVTNSSQALQPTLKEISETLKKIREAAENNTVPEPENITKGINLSHEAGEIIKNLTEITKLEEGRYVYDFQKVNLTNLINQVAEKARGIAENYNISLSLSVPDNIQVTADSQKITAVFSTIIDNAIKYNNEGGLVEISVTLQENFAEITVSDTGIGIEEEELDKIFNKFYRTERGAEIIPNASGLGLYIARKIIERHRGKIWVESTPERGSAFHFTLPLNL